MAANSDLTPQARLARAIFGPSPAPARSPEPRLGALGATSQEAKLPARAPLVVLNPDRAQAPGVNVHEQIRRRVSMRDDVAKALAKVAAPASPPAAGSAAPATIPAAGRALSMRERLAEAAKAAAAAGIPSLEGTGPSGGGTAGDDHEGPSSRGSEVIVGTLNSVKEFSSWAVGSLWTEDRIEIRVTGESLVGLTEGLEYALKGRRTEHATYGPGFDVDSAQPTISPNDQAIEKFLIRSFKGIGDAKAAKYVKSIRADGGDEAVEKLRQQLLTSPWELDLTKIAKGAKFNEEEDPLGAMKQLMVTRNLMLNLGGKGGLREATAKLLANFLITESRPKDANGKPIPTEEMDALGAGDVVSATWAALMLNPYAPIHEVLGYGFAMAESIAAVAGIPKDSPLRLGALVEHAVEEACKRRGHTFLRTAEFVDAIRYVDPSAPAQLALEHAIRQELVVIDNRRVYPERLLTAEKDVARRIAKLMRPAEPLTKRSADDVRRKLAKEPEKINPTFKDGFDKDQVDAIAGIMTGKQRLHVLTGGPGTGKTAIMEVLLTLLKHKTFAFCGPTGKSAKVLTGRVSDFGYRASTVNSLLKGAEEGGFEINEQNPLDVDILVVDENTMNGIGMASGILAALPDHTHLIFLGDPGLPAVGLKPGTAGQLPSISPGRFMQDLLMLPGVQHVHLTKTYRNSGGILEVVKEVERGNLSTTDREAVKFSHVLPAPEEGFPLVMDDYLTRVSKDGFENTFLVMPIRKGDRETPGWNTTYANHVLRGVCNPFGQRLPGTTLHLGDRIMCRENMKIPQPSPGDMGVVTVLQPGTQAYGNAAPKAPEPKAAPKAGSGNDAEAFFEAAGDDEGEKVVESVVNGDTGTIVAFAMATGSKALGSPKWVRLALDDGRTVEYPGSDISMLDHAYAGTVHSAQGSEYRNVIMVVTPGSPDFMHQNMLLTGFSRPRNDLKIWGDDKVIKKIAATPMPGRNSGLVDRVKQELDDADSEQPADEGAPAETNS